MGIVLPHRVHLDVKSISGQELLINEGALLADLSALDCWEELRAMVISLPEEYIVASPTRTMATIVNDDFMVFSIDRLL